MTGRNSWKQNKGATVHVRRLLEESGILLESQVASVCQEFVDSRHKKFGVRTHTQSLSYGKDTEESPLRQIDQCLSLYKEFDIDERTGIALHALVTAEAKYRKDAEIFGVPLPPNSYRPRIAIVSAMHGSQLADAIFRAKPPFESVPLVEPVLLEITEGKTPRKVLAENLVYNAAAALYDFLKFDLSRDESEPWGGEFLSRMRLVNRFEAYLREKHYAWWSVIGDWMKANLSTPAVTTFNKEVFGNTRIHFGVTAHVPVLCINGPLYEVAGLGEPDTWSFKAQKCLLTKVRVPGWPGRLRLRLMRYTAEPPLLVTNLNGLLMVLESVLDWFLRVEKALKDSDPKLKERWPLEASFFQVAIKKFGGSDTERIQELRSDLDIFRLM